MNITGLILKAKGTDDYKIYIDDVIVTEDASLINSQVNGSKVRFIRKKSV